MNKTKDKAGLIQRLNLLFSKKNVIKVGSYFTMETKYYHSTQLGTCIKAEFRILNHATYMNK